MMISPAANPYAAAAALDRQLRSPGPSDDASSDSGPPDGGPDVVVTLSQGASAPPSTYDASGKLAGAPDPVAKASEPDDGGDDATSADATAGSTAASSDSSSTDDANVDEDAAVAA